MKKIMILYKDGTVDTKKESKLTKSDIKNSEYLLVSISPENETYVMIEPSKYLLFTKAIIDYQLCVSSTDVADSFDEFDIVELNPVHCETESVCDMISLLTCMDRLTSVNQMMNPEYISDSGMMSIGLCYFRLRLFKTNKIIFDEEFVIKSCVNILYNAHNVTKHFKAIYNNSIISELFYSKEFLYLYTSKNQVQWKVSKTCKKNALIGIPLPYSNTITFLKDYQYETLLNYKYLELNTLIYYEKNDVIAKMSEKIVNGEDSVQRKTIYNELSDVYMDECRYIRGSYTQSIRLIEVVTNILFILNMIYLTYSELYGPYNSDEEMRDYDFDIIVTFTLSHKSSSSHSIEFSMNRFSILSIFHILNNLE